MKNIIFLSALLFISNACAQERIIDPDKIGDNYIPKKGDYIINNFIDSFVGEYNFHQNEINFYMKLEKKKFCDNYTEVCYDRIYGQIELKHNNNTTIEKSEMPNKHKVESSDFKDIIPQVSSILIENDKTTLNIYDSIKQKSIEGILIKLDNRKYSLKLKEKSYGILQKNKKNEKGFTLPVAMILTKTN